MTKEEVEHLSNLLRNGTIVKWYDQRIVSVFGDEVRFDFRTVNASDINSGGLKVVIDFDQSFRNNKIFDTLSRRPQNAHEEAREQARRDMR